MFAGHRTRRGPLLVNSPSSSACSAASRAMDERGCDASRSVLAGAFGGSAFADVAVGAMRWFPVVSILVERGVGEESRN